MLVKVDGMYNLLKNLLANDYRSINEVREAFSKLLLKSALPSLIVCCFPPLLNDRYQMTKIITLPFFSISSDYQDDMIVS